MMLASYRDSDGCVRAATANLDGDFIQSLEGPGLTECHSDLAVGWSSSNIVVTARPGDDTLHLTAFAIDGDLTKEWDVFSALDSSVHVDVATDSLGRTDAILSGDGDDIVFFNVDDALRSGDDEHNVIAAVSAFGVRTSRLLTDSGRLVEPPMEVTIIEGPSDVVGDAILCIVDQSQ